MRIGILGSGLMGGKLGSIFARAAAGIAEDDVDEPLVAAGGQVPARGGSATESGRRASGL